MNPRQSAECPAIEENRQLPVFFIFHKGFQGEIILTIG
jgi:hypothetical protein